MHIGKSFIYQKNLKKQGLSDQECLEQTLQAFSKYDVKRLLQYTGTITILKIFKNKLNKLV